MRLQLIFIGILSLAGFHLAAQTVTATSNVMPANGTTGTLYVGSGTLATPINKASIGGSLKLFNTGNSGINSPSLYLRNTTATTGRNYYLNTDNLGNFRIIDSNATNASRFHISGVAATLGFIGIGTATPTSLLSAGSAVRNSKIAVFDNGTIRSGLGWQAGQLRLHLSATTDKFSFLGTEAAATDLMTILGTGNVGIGVAPTAVFHLKAGTTAANTAPLKFTSGSPTTTPELGALHFNNGLLMLDSSNTVRDTLATRSWARKNIVAGGGSSQWTTGALAADITNVNTGNVGIGVAAPVQKLDVNGMIKSSTGFTYGGTIGGTWDVNGTFSRYTTSAATDGIDLITEKTPSSIRLRINNAARGIVLDGASANFLFMGGSGETLSGIGNVNGTGNLAFLYSTAANSQTEGMRLTNTGNVGIGTSSPSKLLDVNGDALINGLNVGLGGGNIVTNTVLGKSALVNNTTGNQNVAIGFENQSLGGATQFGNTSMGYQALKTISGSTVTAIGYRAAFSGGSVDAVAIGRQSLYSMVNNFSYGTNGTTAVGSYSLYSLAGGNGNFSHNNTALGWGAGYGITTGVGNTAIGVNSMGTGTLGVGTPGITSSANVAVGINTLFSSKTGSQNVALGHYAGFSITSGNYNVIIGGSYGASIATASNQMILSDGQGNERMKIDSLGQVGIGTTTPVEKLDVSGNIKFSGALMPNNTPGTAGQVLTSAGPGLAPTWAAAGGGSSQWTTAGSNIYYNTAGSVGIGVTDLSDVNYKLIVETGIKTRKVKVTQTAWPDYVFDRQYKLPSLHEVEKFIKANNHLPEVPSAEEIEKDGLNLGDNQAVLLKKIEELTLYAIDADKKIEQQQQQMELQKKQSEQQQQQINLLQQQAELIKQLQEEVKKIKSAAADKK